MLNAEDAPDLLVSRVAATVRRLREQRGTSVGETAAAAGVAPSTLAQLEAGRANPSIETLWAVARALGVTFGQLIEPPDPDVHVIRAGEGVRVDAAGAPFLARLLVSARRRGAFELYQLETDVGPVRVAEAHGEGVSEHLLVLAGSMRAGPTDQPVELCAGDLLTFRADVAHVYETLAPATRALLLMDYP